MAEQTPTESADQTSVGPTGNLNAADESGEEAVDTQGDYRADDEDPDQANGGNSEDWDGESDSAEATDGDEGATDGGADEDDLGSDWDAASEDVEHEPAALDGSLDEYVGAAVVRALRAPNSSAFFRGLLRSLRTMPGASGNSGNPEPDTQPRPGTASAKGSARSHAQRAEALSHLVALTQRCTDEAATEADAFAEFSELFVVDELDEALPILAGIVARRVSAPFLARSIRQTESLAKPLMQAATRAARVLVARQGRQAIRVLPGVARVVATRASRNGEHVATLPRNLVALANRVAVRPSLVRRLLQMNRTGPVTHGPMGRVYQITGPVEITIRQL